MHAKQSVARPGNPPSYPPFSSDDPKSDLASQSGVTMPKSTSMPGNNSGLRGSDFRRETTSQEWPSNAAINGKAPLYEPPIDAAGTGPVGASSQRLRTREPHFGGHRTPAVPMPASSSRQTTASRKDFGGPEIEPDIRPRGSQPPVSADNSQSVAVHPASYSNPSSGSASTAAQSRIGQHEAVTSPGPTLSVSSIQPTTRPTLGTIPPPSQNAPPARTSQETRGDASFDLPRMEALRKGDRSPLPQTDPHRDRNENRSRAQQLDRTPSVQSSAQSFTYPPPSLNQPNVSTSLSPPRAAPQGTHSGGPQVRYAEGLSEFPRPYDERNAKAYAEETRYANPSVAPHTQYSQPQLTVAPVGHPSRSQPAPDPRRMDKDNSRIQRIEGIDREAKRPIDELTSDEVRKWGPVSDERATHRDDSITHSGTGHRRKAEPNPTSSHAPDTGRYPNAPATGDPRRQVGQSTTLAPPLGGPQAFTGIAPPPVFLSSTSEPKNLTRAPSNQGLITPGTASTQGISSTQGPNAPPLSYPRSYNDFASRASREAQFESKAGSVITSLLTHQPDQPLASRNSPPIQTRRDKGSDTSFGVPGDRSAGSHYPHASATLPHDYANSKRPSMEQPSATAGFKTSYSRAGDPWSGGDSEASSEHGRLLCYTPAENKGDTATGPSSSWGHTPSYHTPARYPSQVDSRTIRPADPRRGDQRRITKLGGLEPLAFSSPESARAFSPPTSPLELSPPKSPFSGRPRPQAPREILPAPRLVAVPSIATCSVPPGGVVPRSTQEKFSNIANKKFSSAGAHSHPDHLDDENDGSGQGGPVGSISHWKEGRHQEVEHKKGVEVHEMVAGVRAIAAEVPQMATEVHEIGAQEHKKGAEVHENSVVLHTKGTAHADATCWSRFRSLFSRSSRKSSPD